MTIILPSDRAGRRERFHVGRPHRESKDVGHGSGRTDGRNGPARRPVGSRNLRRKPSPGRGPASREGGRAGRDVPPDGMDGVEGLKDLEDSQSEMEVDGENVTEESSTSRKRQRTWSRWQSRTQKRRDRQTPK